MLTSSESPTRSRKRDGDRPLSREDSPPSTAPRVQGRLRGKCTKSSPRPSAPWAPRSPMEPPVGTSKPTLVQNSRKADSTPLEPSPFRVVPARLEDTDTVLEILDEEQHGS